MPGFVRVGLVWLHVLGIVVWIGGLLFQLLVVCPLLRQTPVTVEWRRFRVRLDRSFRAVMWPAIGIVLLSGLGNVVNVLYTAALAGSHVPATFVRLLSLKLLLVAGMLVLHGIQRFVLQPRLVTLLTHLPAESTTCPNELLQLQRLSWRVSSLVVSASAVVILLGLLLHLA